MNDVLYLNADLLADIVFVFLLYINQEWLFIITYY